MGMPLGRHEDKRQRLHRLQLFFSHEETLACSLCRLLKGNHVLLGGRLNIPDHHFVHRHRANTSIRRSEVEQHGVLQGGGRGATAAWARRAQRQNASDDGGGSPACGT